MSPSVNKMLLLSNGNSSAYFTDLPLTLEIVISGLKQMYSILFLFMKSSLPPAACSRLYSRNSAWASKFSRAFVASVIVNACYCQSLAFLVKSYFLLIDLCLKYLIEADYKYICRQYISLKDSSDYVEEVNVTLKRCFRAFLVHNINFDRCPWCNGYRRTKWTRRHEFKSWTRLNAFHIALIPLGKV